MPKSQQHKSLSVKKLHRQGVVSINCFNLPGMVLSTLLAMVTGAFGIASKLVEIFYSGLIQGLLHPFKMLATRLLLTLVTAVNEKAGAALACSVTFISSLPVIRNCVSSATLERAVMVCLKRGQQVARHAVQSTRFAIKRLFGKAYDLTKYIIHSIFGIFVFKFIPKIKKIVDAPCSNCKHAQVTQPITVRYGDPVLTNQLSEVDNALRNGELETTDFLYVPVSGTKQTTPSDAIHQPAPLVQLPSVWPLDNSNQNSSAAVSLALRGWHLVGRALGQTGANNLSNKDSPPIGYLLYPIFAPDSDTTNGLTTNSPSNYFSNNGPSNSVKSGLSNGVKSGFSNGVKSKPNNKVDETTNDLASLVPALISQSSLYKTTFGSLFYVKHLVGITLFAK